MNPMAHMDQMGHKKDQVCLSLLQYYPEKIMNDRAPGQGEFLQ